MLQEDYKMQHYSLLSFFFLLLNVSLSGQAMSNGKVDEMVSIISDLIKENYVLPERGKTIAKAFTEDWKRGRFYELETLKKLDSTMTKSLREASQDFHLFTWNNKEIVQQLQAEKSEDESTETTSFFNNKKAYNSNFGFDKIEILPDNIGYIKLSQINISEHSLKKLYGAMQLVEHTDALIIDLRNNGGGGSTVGSVLETFFLEEYTDLLEFKKRDSQPEMNATVPWLLEKRYLKPLYLLVNKGTASAAEAFAFALKNQGRCTIVGQPSSGGAHMNSYFLVNQDFIIAISTAAPFLPGTDKSWEGTGVQPDYVVAADKALEKAVELIKFR
ncbi:MAG: S41 family peptidase [Bacteroidota bacterium]